MKTSIKAAGVAIALECVLGFGARVTCAPCGSGGPRGLLWLVGEVTWTFHTPGFLLAEKLAWNNTSYWSIMLLTGLVESFGLVWLTIALYRWKHAS
jgi:hypothetical protein